MKRHLVILLSVFIITAVAGVGVRFAFALSKLDLSGTDAEDIKWPAGETLSFVQGTTERFRIDATTGALVIPGNLTVNGTLSAGGVGGWTKSGSNVYLTTSTDNVGIGTTGPGYPLHVSKSGSVEIYSEGTTQAGFSAKDSGAGVDVKEARLLSNDGFFHVQRINDARTVADSYLSVNLTSGNVGIGDTGPTNKLSVSGDIAASGSLKITGNGNSYIQTGNVGIGTTSPGSKLHVSGTDTVARLTGSGSYVDFILNNSSHTSYIGDYSYGLGFFSNTGSTPTMVISPGAPGNVGIGTTGPATLLHTFTTSDNLTTLQAGAASGIQIRFKHGGTQTGFINSNTTNIFSVYQGTSNEVFAITNTGNVGIGTTGPVAALDIQSSLGTFRQKEMTTVVTDQLVAAATQARRFEIARVTIDFNDWNFVGPIEVELYEKYWSQGLKKKYYVSYGYTSNANVYLAEVGGKGANNFQVTIGSEVVISGDLRYIPIYVDVDEYSYVTAVIKTNRTLTTSNPPPGSGQIWVNSSPTGSNIADFTADSTVYMNNVSGFKSVFNEGNVGIGTTNPAYKLDVQGGQINTSGGLCIAGDCKTAWSQIGGAWTLSGSNLYPTSTGYNVGIGTTNPGATLHVSGGTGSQITNTTPFVTGSTEAFRLGNTSGMFFDVQVIEDTVTAANRRIDFELGNSPRLTIKNDTGNVGIGRTDPVVKLEVVGAVRNSAPSSGYLELSGLLPGYADNTYPTLKTNGTWIYLSTAGIYNGHYGNDGMHVRALFDYDNEAYYVDPAGTSSLNLIQLQVGSKVNLSGGTTYRLEGNSAFLDTLNTGSTGDPLEINYLTAGPVKICASLSCATYSAFFDTSGNVGIGTTSPGYKLDVAGNANISGAIYGPGYAAMPLVAGGGNSWYGMGTSDASGGATSGGGHYPYAINNHTGLAFSAHSAYGGIRFYNQNYPTAPMTATPIMKITDGVVTINSNLYANSNLYIGGLRFVDNGGYYLQNFSGNNSAGGFELYRNDGNRWGYFYGDGSGIGILNGAGGWAVLANGSVNAQNTQISFYTDNTRRAYVTGGGLYFDIANPQINASSYFVAPGGAHFSSGTVYTEATIQARGGVGDDGGNLELLDNVYVSGYFGIGVTSPAHPLDVRQNISSAYPIARFHNTATGGAAYGVAFYSNASNANARNLAIVLNGNTYGDFGIKQSAAQGGDPMTGTYRLHIQGNGFVGIGRISSSYILDVAGDIRIGTSGTNGCLVNFGGGTIVGACSSDLRLKKDIVPLGGALEKLVQLRPVYYKWRSEVLPDRGVGTQTNLGLIAQEVEKVLPELVSADAKGYKTVSYGVELAMLTIQAIKEQQKQIEPLLAMMGRFTIDERGTLTVKKVVTDELELGGYCVKVKEGKLEAEEGGCR